MKTVASCGARTATARTIQNLQEKRGKGKGTNQYQVLCTGLEIDWSS